MAPQEFSIRLHLGAHRTGSTSVQACLDENSVALKEAGILALTPPRSGHRDVASVRQVTNAVRKASTSRPLRRWLKIRTARKTLNGFLADQRLDCLVISEENLLGDSFRRGHPGLYPDVKPMLNALRSTMARDPDSVHLTIRDYASFVVSDYAMRVLYAGERRSFADMHHDIADLKEGWFEVLSTIRAIFPGAEVTYATMQTDPVNSALSVLVGERMDPTGLRRPERRLNKSPTDHLISHLLKRGPISKAEADALIENEDDGKAFSPLPEKTEASLGAKYERDLVRLAQEFRVIGGS